MTETTTARLRQLATALVFALEDMADADPLADLSRYRARLQLARDLAALVPEPPVELMAAMELLADAIARREEVQRRARRVLAG